MSRLAAFLARHKQRLARLVLALTVLGIVAQLWPSWPRTTEMELLLGEHHADVVELRVAFVQGQEELSGVAYHFEHGAPEALRHSVKLPPGELLLRCELRDRRGVARTVERSLQVPVEGLLRVRLDRGRREDA